MSRVIVAALEKQAGIFTKLIILQNNMTCSLYMICTHVPQTMKLVNGYSQFRMHMTHFSTIEPNILLSNFADFDVLERNWKFWAAFTRNCVRSSKMHSQE